jgi:glycosyltransferase involved in cell wall biosynthesis
LTAPVAINARAAVRRETGGVERVARELSARLPVLLPERYRVVRPPRALAYRAGQAWEQAVLPIAARDSAVILSLANLAPVASRRNVVYVHDAAPFHGPGWFGRVYLAWHRALLPRIAGHARLILVPSEFVKAELVELFGVGHERIRVAPSGVDERFSPEAAPPPRARPYMLAVGTESARKNLALLDRATPTLTRAGFDVLIAGSSRGYLRNETAERRAHRLGYVAEDDLPALYAGAAAVAMPSLYEGLGLPCLEAMASGTPVVAARRAALPETCGGAALYTDPDDPEAFAAALLRAAGPERERLAAAGRKRAATFTWERTTRLVDAAIAELLTER